MHVPPKYITTTFRPLLVRYVNNMLNICDISVVTNIIITNPALVDAASEPASGIQGGAGLAVPCWLNAAGWVTVDLRRVMVSVMKVYR